jgi:hypothetical protein
MKSVIEPPKTNQYVLVDTREFDEALAQRYRVKHDLLLSFGRGNSCTKMSKTISVFETPFHRTFNPIQHLPKLLPR